ncbi:sulfotransferase [Chloroflexi bacterium TSY]|nr:sulfotransferase [Chloroflexi bacterium TSY]
MLLLISGHSRSGTTLLQRLCNGHPDIATTLEFSNFIYVNRSYLQNVYHLLYKCWYVKHYFWNPPPEQKPWHRSWQNFVFALRYLMHLGLCKKLRSVDFASAEKAFHACMPAVQIIGDKFGIYQRKLDLYKEVDNLAILIIYRDCRDVTQSVLKKVETDWRSRGFAKNMDTVEKIAKRWVKDIENMEQHANQIHIIRYEDLIRDPKREMVAVGEYLNVDPNSFPVDIVRGDSIGKYEQALSEEQLVVVMKIAGPTMKRLGYC